ncbi:MAG: SBBP repeat-containing protein [Bacteroidota bacterium]|nr:SBBP repeat-containing protein [Bacteroidota bacterium]
MKRIIFAFVLLLCNEILLASGVLTSTASNPIAGVGQLGFIENKGQILNQNKQLNKEVLYLYNGFGIQVLLKQNGFSYELIKTETSQANAVVQQNQKLTDMDIEVPAPATLFIHRVDISFVGSKQSGAIIAYEPAADFVNYYRPGTGETGAIHVAHYKKIVYQNIYPNIDIEFVLNDKEESKPACRTGRFKYNVIVHPGGNPEDIKLRFEGASQTSLTGEGNILIETAYGKIEESIPYSYVTSGNAGAASSVNTSSDKKVHAQFINLEAANLFGIEIPYYDPAQTLVIDPAPWATYYGGTGPEYGSAIATDAKGNVFITGTTGSYSAIASSGAHQVTFAGNDFYEAFVVKFDADGVRQWATYYGGTGNDHGYGIATDNAGNIYVTGLTSSASGMATTGSFQTTYGGGDFDAYLVKFNTAGARLWGTYYGGAYTDMGHSVATDPDGNVVMGASSYSTTLASSGAAQTTNGGDKDAITVKFNAAGSRLWATYFGGGLGEFTWSVVSDYNGNILITGRTASSNAIATTGAFHTAINGVFDTYIAKYNAAGVLQWSTYFGGPADEFATGIAADANGNIFITGHTQSNSAIATVGAYQTTYAGGSFDAYIAKFNPAGAIQWSTYYGGSDEDNGWDIVNDPGGNVFVAGNTYSATGIASSGAYKTTFDGITDAFILKLNSGGLREWATYFGGSGSEHALMSIARSPAGTLVITGQTTSTSGLATSGTFQTVFGGNLDAYVASFNNPDSLLANLSNVLAANNGIRIFPNPSTQTLYIIGAENSAISVYDLNGSLMLKENNVNEIDVSTFSNGLYILRIEKGILQKTLKFIKN